MKAYLFTCSQTCTQAQIQAVLNATQAIETWVAPFPQVAILVSKLDIQDLGAILRRRLPGVWFIVTETDQYSVDGWLPADFWEYVNNPYQAWSRRLFEQLAPPQQTAPKGLLSSIGAAKES